VVRRQPPDTTGLQSLCEMMAGRVGAASSSLAAAAATLLPRLRATVPLPPHLFQTTIPVNRVNRQFRGCCGRITYLDLSHNALGTNRSGWLAVYMSICLSVCLSVCLPACLSVCLSARKLLVGPHVLYTIALE
jgi:hypothetical protein